jgi:uncharacterized protein involved in response to NO
LPAPFGRFDGAALALGAAALLAWVAAPMSAVGALMLLVAGAAQALRMMRWAGGRTWREPLVLVLHAGYAFIPLGFVTLAVSILRPDALPPGDALHAWTVGAIGVMTLAVMTRATLGHTGRDLTATAATCIIYLLVVTAALARSAVFLVPSFAPALLLVAAAAWMGAFAIFALVYGPMLLFPRHQG